MENPTHLVQHTAALGEPHAPGSARRRPWRTPRGSRTLVLDPNAPDGARRTVRSPLCEAHLLDAKKPECVRNEIKGSCPGLYPHQQVLPCSNLLPHPLRVQPH